MDYSLKQGLGVLVWVVSCGLIIIAFGTFISNTGTGFDSSTIKDSTFFKSDINDQIINASAPQLIVQEIHLSLNQSFNLNDLVCYAVAQDSIDGDISSSIKVFGQVDINTPGTYSVKFSVTNTKGLKTSYIKNVLVD